ncbi:hypothetical protein CC78DRAFT_618731 [Lojkania enalia]|uniref:Uncharacterized protein n=1 Tax=Lojkania enalia TaxID=147567 RepID=A0A9P4K4Z3_9PLEO|nr:hypothetical protein CC78DRAFT_618731 [Didymosphaeria enalia]
MARKPGEPRRNTGGKSWWPRTRPSTLAWRSSLKRVKSKVDDLERMRSADEHGGNAGYYPKEHTPVTSFRFLDLPREPRDEVYAYFLFPGRRDIQDYFRIFESIRVQAGYQAKPRTKPMRWKWSRTALLVGNRQVCMEGLQVLYGACTFLITLDHETYFRQ